MPSSSVTELRSADSRGAQSVGPSVPSAGRAGATGGPRSAVPYDFRRPAKLAREHVRALQMGFDTFARRLTTLLTSGLRQVCEVELREVSQQNYDEYIGGLATQTLIMPVEAEPIGTGAIELSLPVALAAIDHMLGGPGGSQPTRELTDIETTLFARLVDQILSTLTYGLDAVVPLRMTTGKIEYNPQFLQIAAAADAVVVADFALRIAREDARLTVCLPLAGLLSQLMLRQPRELSHLNATPVNTYIRDQLAETPVELQVSFDPVGLDSSTVLSLSVGDIVPLQHRVGAPLRVRVGGTDVARAIAGKSGSALAALIVDSPAQLSKESA